MTKEKQQRRDEYLKNRVLPIFEIEVKFRVENDERCLTTSFNNIGDLVNWAILQMQIVGTQNNNVALYGTQKNIEDDF